MQNCNQNRELGLIWTEYRNFFFHIHAIWNIYHVNYLIKK